MSQWLKEVRKYAASIDKDPYKREPETGLMLQKDELTRYKVIRELYPHLSPKEAVERMFNEMIDGIEKI